MFTFTATCSNVFLLNCVATNVLVITGKDQKIYYYLKQAIKGLIHPKMQMKA